MPKQRITKEQILKAAFQLVRKDGYRSVNARSVAKAAGCSVQPIYSCYGNMEDLLEDLFEYCCGYQIDYVRQRLDRQNYFGSAGQCHISFACEERQLFEFVFQSKYVKGTKLEDIYCRYGLEEVTESIERELKLNGAEARQFYLDMMIYTHGIATMIAVEAMTADPGQLHKSVDRAYHAFLEKIREEKNESDYT